MTADTPSPSEVVEKLTALRVMCESCNQPLYVEILDEVLSAISTRSSTVDEATVGWQPIETAPDCEDGVLIVDATKPNPAVGVARFMDGKWRGAQLAWGFVSEAIWPKPTHWRPLPEPPTSLPSVAVQPIGER